MRQLPDEVPLIQGRRFNDALECETQDNGYAMELGTARSEVFRCCCANQDILVHRSHSCQTKGACHV
jgi:hypothetical protein